ncbi:MAG: PHP domain-containing protein [Myxococcota bacterium]|nr:PHP domain-containing protein [Myxococcota bacterium]
MSGELPTPSQLSRHLRHLALVYTLHDQERRAKACTRAAWPLSQLSPQALLAAHQAGTLGQLRGVDPIAAKAAARFLDGTPQPGLSELEDQTPAGLFDLARLPGLGAAKVKALWTELGVNDLTSLQDAVDESRLNALPGFGPKTRSKLIKGLAHALGAAGKVRRDTAQQALAALTPLLDAQCAAWEEVGPLAQGHELVHHLHIVAIGAPELPESAVEVTLAPTDRAAFGVRVLQLSSDPAHAAQLDLDAPELLGLDADAIYQHRGFHPTPIERRRADIPLVRLAQRRPRLVRRSDLQGALHNHTTASDGRDSLEAMREAAAQRGLRYLGISEHSQSSVWARGLEPERLRSQGEQLRALNGQGHTCRLLAGVEADILKEGDLDYPDTQLHPLDFVVASVHQRFSLPPQDTLARMTRATSAVCADIMGHPTGRLLLSRPPNDFDMELWLQHCARMGVAVELNASPKRMDLAPQWLARAKELGVPVSIAADAHRCSELDNLDHGVALARRAGLGPDDVLNTRSAADVLAWVQQRRAARRAQVGPG